MQAIIEAVKQKVHEADRPLGFLKDAHLKWLIGFTYLFFDTRRADFDIDFVKYIIHITPYQANKGAKIPVEWRKWLRFKWVLWRKKHERDIMPYLGLSHWRVIFHRTRPKVYKNTIGVRKEENNGESPCRMEIDNSSLAARGSREN